VRSTTDHEATSLLLAGGLLRDDGERLDRHPELVRERLGGLRGLAVLVGGALGRSDDLLVEIGLVLGDAVHEQRESPRCSERAHVPEREPQALELRPYEARQRGEGSVHEGGGQLLGSDLEQERLRHGGQRDASRKACRPGTLGPCPPSR